MFLAKSDVGFTSLVSTYFASPLIGINNCSYAKNNEMYA
jgi:hypothetical protein